MAEPAPPLRHAPAHAEPTGDPCPQCGATVSGSWLVCAWCGTALAAPAELAPRAELSAGRFSVRRVLGRGGFGITYEVDDRRLQRRVAIKELFPDSAVRHGSMVLTPPHARTSFAQARERFLGEARVLARFSHPGIVRVFEVFEEHNTAYLVMELLEGRTLSGLLRKRDAPFSEDEVLDVAARVGSALRAVHAAGVMHRDLNPTNVVLTDHGRVVLIDFGIARSFEPGTQSLTRVVTPGYAPPEQYLGSARFGPTTDVYGLAATLYRLLTDRVPVPSLDRQGGVLLPAPRTMNEAIGKELSDAVLDGLELNPDHRPQSIDAFLARMGADDRSLSTRSSILLDHFPVTADTPVHPSPARAATGADPPTELSTGLAAAATPGATPTVGHPAAPTVGHPAMRPPAGPASTVASPAYVAPPPQVRPVSPPPLTPTPPLAAPAPPMPVGAVGPHRRGRPKATLPLLAAAVALASAAPVAVVALLVVGVLPALATGGDLLRHRYQRWHGPAEGWFARSGAGVVVPVRFLANLVVSLFRSVPALALDAVLVGLWVLGRHGSVAVAWTDALLRVTGVAVAGLLLYPVGRGSRRFRTGVAVHRITDEVVDPDGRLRSRGWVMWLVAIGLVALAFWLRPDPWPVHA